MSQNLGTRLEYIQTQVSGAKASLRLALKHMPTANDAEDNATVELLTEAQARLIKASAVLCGAEAPTDKRGRLDLEADVIEDKI